MSDDVKNCYDFLAQRSDRFTGADITEVCQKAQKFAIKESIAKDREWRKNERERVARLEGKKPEDVEINIKDCPDFVNEICRRHFEMAWRTARISVNPGDLQRYVDFKEKLDPRKDKGPGGNYRKINWPADSSDHVMKDDDDDLYD